MAFLTRTWKRERQRTAVRFAHDSLTTAGSAFRREISDLVIAEGAEDQARFNIDLVVASLQHHLDGRSG